MEIKGHIIDTGVQEELFGNHLAEKDNLRIFFSGKFGSGKTTFLKKYFEKNSDKYRAIHLFPVNYSVAENRDIFELVKADILMEIMDKFGDDVEFEKLDISNEWAFYFQMKDGLGEMLPALLKLIPGIGGQLSDVATALLKLEKGIATKRQQYAQNELGEVGEFMKALSFEKGSIYELNLITEIIQGLIFQLKESDKETVLLIDDLDRIDPAHLFRIMNVFSAHFDHSDGIGNKFGFNRIIFIADLKNIQSIYHHFYGLETDISGYLDKFFSKEIFFFEIQVIGDINAVLKTSSFPYYQDLVLLNDIESRVDVKMIFEVLNWICLNSTLSIRSLKRNENRRFTTIKSSIQAPSSDRPKRIFGVQSFSIIGSLFGSMSELSKIVFQMRFDYSSFSDSGFRYFTESIIGICEYKTHAFRVDKEFTISKENLPESLLPKSNETYTLKQDSSTGIHFCKLSSSNLSAIRERFNFKEGFIRCIDIIEKYGV